MKLNVQKLVSIFLEFHQLPVQQLLAIEFALDTSAQIPK